MDTSNQISSGSNIAQGGPSWNPALLLKTVRIGDLDAIEKFLKDNPEAVNARITSLGETALHIATLFGHFHIVEKLVQLMSEKDLELTTNVGGLTALHHAASVFNNNENSIKAAKCMIEKNERLVAIPSTGGYIPVTLALDFGHTKKARFLYSVTRFEVLLAQNGKYGAHLLNLCYYHKMFDIALDLIKRCPRIAVMDDQHTSNFLVTLAAKPYAFQREIQLPFWKRWLHTWVHVHHEPAIAFNEVVIDTPETTGRDDRVRGTSPGRLRQWIRNILHLLGIFEKINEADLAHKQYLELLQAACNVIPSLNDEELHRYNIFIALLQAARQGNPEFIVEAVKMNLSLLYTEDLEGKRLFQVAVQYRQAKVFNLVHGLVLKHVVNFRDKYGNTMLHVVGELAPPMQLNHISGALLQMQRELQWFKEVESVMLPTEKDNVTRGGLTARELFMQEHKDLVKQGEKWTKGTASSCSVVAALIVTITFAVAFTVPGGNDQATGYPIFLHKNLFMVFVISNAVSLFSSSTSLLMFLGLLTSRYAVDDFLKSLPIKLIIGLSTMFISIATMMIAFCAALFLMLQSKYSWIVIPVAILASFPVTLYIWLQVPLLVEIFMSTWGPGIFDRNVKPWP